MTLLLRNIYCDLVTIVLPVNLFGIRLLSLSVMCFIYNYKCYCTVYIQAFLSYTVVFALY